MAIICMGCEEEALFKKITVKYLTKIKKIILTFF